MTRRVVRIGSEIYALGAWVSPVRLCDIAGIRCNFYEHTPSGGFRTPDSITLPEDLSGCVVVDHWCHAIPESHWERR